MKIARPVVRLLEPGVLVFVLLLVAQGACTAVQPMPDRDGERALLRLDVQPTSTKVFIDSEYRGVVKGWTAQTVPVRAGQRRVKLRAEGYITRRFDVELAPGEQVTLRVTMEPALDDEPPELHSVEGSRIGG